MPDPLRQALSEYSQHVSLDRAQRRSGPSGGDWGFPGPTCPPVCYSWEESEFTEVTSRHEGIKLLIHLLTVSTPLPSTGSGALVRPPVGLSPFILLP